MGSMERNPDPTGTFVGLPVGITPAHCHCR